MTTEIASAAGEVEAMRLDVRRVRLLPKSGSSISENEDAVGIDDERRRFAVADGATEAFDAHGWAIRLAASWTNTDAAPRTPEEFLQWVELRGAEWAEDWKGCRLPWYAEEKRRAGSFAAFVGIEFGETEDGLAWHAAAIGDSCLLRMRGNELIEAMPLGDHRLFNSAPRLVPTLGASERLTSSDVCIKSGRVEPGDAYWLLSDAMAAWCLRALAEDPNRFVEFSRIPDADESAFERFVEIERASNRLRDDDIALIGIEATRVSDQTAELA